MRHRYIAVKIDDERSIDRRNLLGAFSGSLLRLFGECGASLAELTLIDYDPKVNCAIFRCAREALEMAKASIAAVTEVDRMKMTPQVICVSGTIKALRKKLAVLESPH